jgi:hypothetical protein
MVNLDPRRRPMWRLVKSRPLTVRPSLDITHSGNRCHFLITSGTIQWIKAGPQAPGDNGFQGDKQ